ncbi:microsomal glutathione S-transferase 1-like isoform X2 [Branchiostoma lanceolatum]|uniref:microsomal glutathione S-transferase 1-like isoform X2 n=1 Tax=Branchiostoma lanceolatum TaxID=7740 RepID=UPI0034569397
MASAGLSFGNPVFAAYAAYASLVTLKMFFVVFFTTYTRFSRGVFANPEDVKGNKGAVARLDHPDVERVRRLHRNDLENIPAFLAVGLLYVLTGPSPGVALWHFRVFTAARCLHTVSYLAAVQPWRALGFIAGILTTTSMAVQVLMAGAL